MDKSFQLGTQERDAVSAVQETDMRGHGGAVRDHPRDGEDQCACDELENFPEVVQYLTIGRWRGGLWTSLGLLAIWRGDGWATRRHLIARKTSLTSVVKDLKSRRSVSARAALEKALRPLLGRPDILQFSSE